MATEIFGASSWIGTPIKLLLSAFGKLISLFSLRLYSLSCGPKQRSWSNHDYLKWNIAHILALSISIESLEELSRLPTTHVNHAHISNFLSLFQFFLPTHSVSKAGQGQTNLFHGCRIFLDYLNFSSLSLPPCTYMLLFIRFTFIIIGLENTPISINWLKLNQVDLLKTHSRFTYAHPPQSKQFNLSNWRTRKKENPYFVQQNCQHCVESIVKGQSQTKAQSASMGTFWRMVSWWRRAPSDRNQRIWNRNHSGSQIRFRRT